MNFPYWLEQSLISLPLGLWVYLGLGLPYALLVLPRANWAKRVSVLALSFAFGAALLTLWMFILGTIGGINETRLLRFDLSFGGTVILAILGYGLAWRKAKITSPAPKLEKNPFQFDEILLIVLISLGFVLVWLATSYWVFTGYDTLWVYGYEGRLYHLLGYIPEHIGYYPQFLPLQYTFMQLPLENFDDHAARVVVPFIYLGSILAAYDLGERFFSRRVGLYLAAIWALYPHVSQWAFIGDLEIPLAFLFTLSASYFMQAWISEDTKLRRRYALIAGLCFGIAMWTKPTAGAFILGVVLLVGVDFLFKLSAAGKVSETLQQWYPRFEVALITGLACIPLGAVWYLRNFLLGLDVLVFPHPNWLSLATRSGDLLSFPLLALFSSLAYLALKGGFKNGGWQVLLGVILILLGAIPSSPLFDENRRNSPESYIRLWEAMSIIGGLALILWHLRQYRELLSKSLSVILWAYLLALPYFMTWFWSYSYHARLSFAIVPMLILPSALIISQLPVHRWKPAARLAWVVLILILAIQGLTIPIWGVAPTWDWLWVEHYPDDESRYKVHNGDVYLLALELYANYNSTGIMPVVVAPGEQRLPFFVPQMQVITDTLPISYEELDGATHYLYGTLARWRYENDEGIEPLRNRLVASLGRDTLMRRVVNFRDGNFVYELYELHLERRYELPSEDYVIPNMNDEVIFGDAIRLDAISLGNTQLVGNRIFINFLWSVLEVPDSNYHLRLSLELIEDNSIVTFWEAPIAPDNGIYYNTELWEVGEYVLDCRSFELARPRDFPLGQNIYRLRVDFIDINTGEQLPVTINGQDADGFYLTSLFSNGDG